MSPTAGCPGAASPTVPEDTAPRYDPRATARRGPGQLFTAQRAFLPRVKYEITDLKTSEPDMPADTRPGMRNSC